MKLGANHPMGPLALADLVGLDTTLAIIETLHRDLGDPKYRPCPLLRRYVAAGKLGRKTGSGSTSTDAEEEQAHGSGTVSGERAGYVQVYTGDGKGKTTAALGLALRALVTTCVSSWCSS